MPDPKTISDMDQAIATFGSIGQAFAVMRREMMAGGIPRKVADLIVRDTALQWAAGTFNKAPSIQFPKL